MKHMFYNLNDINDSNTDKPDTPFSFHNLIQANSHFVTLLKTRILTSYSLKLFILNTESPC